MAKRKVLRVGQSKAVDHPMGGVFHIFPLMTDELLEYQDSLKEAGLEIEGEGDEAHVVETKAHSLRADFGELVAFVQKRIERVSDFVDADTDEPIESTPAFIERRLWERFEQDPDPAPATDADAEAEEDAEAEAGGTAPKAPKAPKPRTVLTATWALNEAIKLGIARKGDEVKN
jgi:hypothetical protein